MGTTSEKLTYLNETKGKIKQAINGLGGELTDESTFRSYPDELDTAWDKVFDQLPHVEGIGESITLQPTIKAKLTTQLNGNTSQVQYTGEQLLNVNDFIAGTGATTLTILPTGIKIKNGYGAKIDISNLEQNTDYYIQYNNKTISGTSYNHIAVLDGNTLIVQASNVDGLTFNTGTLTSVRLWFYCGGNSSDTNEVEYTEIMLSKGTTEQTYEPYVGSTSTNITPSPNPSYPQPIQVVSGNNSVVVCGKNLLGYNGSLPYSNYNFTLTKSGEVYTAITSAATTGYPYKKIFTIPSGTLNGSYLLKKISLSGTSLVQIRIMDRTTSPATSIAGTDNETTFSITNTHNELSVEVAGNINKTYNETFEILLQSSSITDTTYEPYTGITYPINLPVENLLDKTTIVSTALSNWTVEQITNGIKVNHLTSYSTGQPALELTLKPNTTYTYSQITTTTSGTPRTAIKTTNGSWEYITTGSKTLTTENDGKINILYGSQLDSSTSCNYTNIQLEEGTKANSYTPYGTTPLKLCKIGDYKDYFYKNIVGATDYSSDRELGAWYLKKEIGKVIFDGSVDESWEVSSFGNYYRAKKSISDIKVFEVNDIYLYAQYFHGNTNAMSSVYCKLGDMAHFRNGTNVFFITNETSAENFKTWLSTHNTTLYYPLATPTYTKITGVYDTLNTQLENIYNAMSKKGQTNISQVNNDKPFILDVSALLDSQTYIEQLEAEVEALS